MDAEDTGGTEDTRNPGTLSRETAGGKGSTPTTATLRVEAVMINIRVLSWSLASFSSVSYVVCVLYGLVVPEALHMTGFLEQVLPGFRWLTPAGFVIGLLESFLYGAYAGLVFTPIYNGFRRRWVVE